LFSTGHVTTLRDVNSFVWCIFSLKSCPKSEMEWLGGKRGCIKTSKYICQWVEVGDRHWGIILRGLWRACLKQHFFFCYSSLINFVVLDVKFWLLKAEVGICSGSWFIKIKLPTYFYFFKKKNTFQSRQIYIYIFKVMIIILIYRARYYATYKTHFYKNKYYFIFISDWLDSVNL